MLSREDSGTIIIDAVKCPRATLHLAPGVVAITELCANPRTYRLRRGDIIFDTNDPDYSYRSSGMYFYDGSRVIPPCAEYDDYGTVPTEFDLIVEFPPGYWDLPMPGNFKNLRAYEFVADGRPELQTFEPNAAMPCGCWHDPDNQGISQLWIRAEEPGISGDGVRYYSAEIEITDCEDTIIVITFEGVKYALVTPKTFEDVASALEKCNRWVVKSYYNTANWVDGKYFRTELSEYLESLGVDPRNMLCDLDCTRAGTK